MQSASSIAGTVILVQVLQVRYVFSDNLLCILTNGFSEYAGPGCKKNGIWCKMGHPKAEGHLFFLQLDGVATLVKDLPDGTPPLGKICQSRIKSRNF